MTATAVDSGRFLNLKTPLPDGVLLLRAVSGWEGISKPFRYDLDLAAPLGAEVDFAALMGNRVAATIGTGPGTERHLHGICSRFTEGHRDASFTFYRMEVVPEFWLLTLRSRHRAFQHVSVPDILRDVLKGLEVGYALTATYHPRDYCVQYGETDFDFAGRLMEEEGIFYFFTQGADGHRMVVADNPGGHPELPDPSPVPFETSRAGERGDDGVDSWEKRQELRPSRYAYRDHCFELPGDPLASDASAAASARAGSVEHRLKFGPDERAEIYGYPGAYAQRFDGIGPAGGDRASDLVKINGDGGRTARVRAQEGTVSALVITGEGHSRRFTAGHRFTLTGHHNADGAYVLTSVSHDAQIGGDDRSGMNFGGGVSYRNRFECVPASVHYRPPRLTRKPVVHGTQTATVVGPPGEEIFTDKYGRVKVQFPWDREGKHDADSSCWVRVATSWAGAKWGAIRIPRVGQEVVVAFEEGDPDRPVILGSVYNAAQMPPFTLPKAKMLSGVRSHSYPGGGGDNEISFDDSKGKERMYIHAQYNQDAAVGNNRTETVGVNSTETIGNNLSESVGNNKVVKVGANETTTIGVNQTETVGANKTITIGSNLTETVGINYAETVGAAMQLTVGAVMTQTIGAAYLLTVGAAMVESVGASKMVTVGLSETVSIGKFLSVDAGDQITLKTGSASIVMMKDGTISIQGKDILIKGSGKITGKAGGDMVLKGSKIAQN